MSKRGIDLVASCLALIALLPLFIIIALAIRLDSAGPILYRARRIGRNVREFALYKFRSMVVNADKQGPAITLYDDRRITRVGQLLRKSKMDELPQLINVIKGDMSLVGPRPEDPQYVALYTQEQRKVLSVRPGITSAASVQYRDEATLLTGPAWEQHYINEIMPTKLSMDLQYLLRATIWTDIGILIRTVFAVLR
jgi:lipopolysaccharide/colanic/teichoic acid biosynthesis glycosyltransferase